jgi:hypothetical protein
VLGTPTRVAYGVSRNRAWLYVTDSSKDRLVALDIARIAPTLVPPSPRRAQTLQVRPTAAVKAPE